jgi:hypothetical protein
MKDDENRPESLDDRAARVLGALGDGEESEQAEDVDEPATVSGDAAADGEKQSAKPTSDDGKAREAIAPPVSWPNDDKEAFGRLPRDAQEIIARREGERDRFLSQRTQAVAQRERALEDQRRSYAQHLDAFIEQARTLDPILEEGAQTDWAKLARENPTAYVQKMAAVQQRVQQLRTAHQERQRVADENNRVVAARELEQLGAKVPEFRDPTQRRALLGELGNFLGESGFNKDEIGGLADHRAYLIALDAMRYRKLMKAQKDTAAKRVVATPKVQKPGAAADAEPGHTRLTALKTAARRTGKLDDRAAYVLAALRDA